MKLSDINNITENKYGFSVFDWDENRGEGPKAGPFLVDKCELNLSPDSTPATTAAIFAHMITKNHRVTLKGKVFEAKSIHISGVGTHGDISRNPFIFIAGIQI